ncbi:hypothetical protein Dsin_001180 [Dipteronia sinensis]|uniref:B box-type domain-containing protein n=1 Tax=Dipteronia sinensis TaxID=43782 RepID=A0AAE0EIH5_9ROSI|nr:hypothetical protein Dsin_001180 [Dipteronia sinensis]
MQIIIKKVIMGGWGLKEQMKIQCEVCEAAEAEVLCCADEAVLCWGCDVKVHTANKLSQKHQRVSLLKNLPASSPSSSHLPLCDVCQERSGYFFCLEDRAILCKRCDMSTHTTTPSSYVSSHQRFLIGGIKVSLESSTNSSIETFSNTCLSNFPTYHEESTARMTLDVEANFTETTATSGDLIWQPQSRGHWRTSLTLMILTLMTFQIWSHLGFLGNEIVVTSSRFKMSAKLLCIF